MARFLSGKQWSAKQLSVKQVPIKRFSVFFLKSLLAPVGLTLIASAGIHGGLFLFLPLLPSPSEASEAEAQERDVQLTQLPLSEIGRLPDFAIADSFSAPPTLTDPALINPDLFNFSPDADPSSITSDQFGQPSNASPFSSDSVLDDLGSVSSLGLGGFRTYDIPTPPPGDPLPPEAPPEAPPPEGTPPDEETPPDEPPNADSTNAEDLKGEENNSETPPAPEGGTDSDPPQGRTRGSSQPNPNPIDPEEAREIAALRNLHTYNSSGTTSDAGLAKLDEWYNGYLNQFGTEIELQSPEPVVSTYVSRFCLVDKPEGDLTAAAAVLVDGEGTARDTELLQKTGYELIDKQLKNQLWEQSFPAAGQDLIYQYRFTVVVDEESCEPLPTLPEVS